MEKEKKLDKGTKRNDAATERIDSTGVGLPLHGLEFSEKTKVWLDANPALAKRDESRNVKKGIGRQMMNLNPIEEKEPTKELVGRKRKTAKNKGNEDHPKTHGW